MNAPFVKNFIGAICIIIVIMLVGIDVSAAVYSRECEDYNSKTWGGTGTEGQVRVESHSQASNGLTLHLGPDWSPDDSYGVNDQAVYSASLGNYNNAAITVSYSDDVPGNILKIYLDNVEKWQFKTFYTGGWEHFKRTNQIPLGPISAGLHTIKFILTTGGSYGVNLDCFTIQELQTSNNDAVSFITSLKDPGTGLVRSTEDDTYTTIYKNALAAMVFIHQGDMNSARGIFNFYKSVYDSTSQNFPGFTKEWDTDTGQPRATNYWEGDNSFLLAALTYYDRVNGGLGNYQQMYDALTNWLTQRGNDVNESMIAEGAVDMYAALSPFAGKDDVDSALIKLKKRFYDSVVYSGVSDHAHRGALTFGDLEGFDYINNFYLPNETWDYDDATIVSLYKAFPSESQSNIEISAQWLNAWRIWQSDLTLNLSSTANDLNKLWLNGAANPDSRGLPYYAQGSECSRPMIDPTAYMLFYYWNFNPCVPGDKFAQLYDCEDYNSTTWGGTGTAGQIRVEPKSAAFNGEALHIGADTSDTSYGVNDQAAYDISLLEEYSNASIRIRYSDDVAGNVIKIYLDNVEKGQFQTSFTGGWNSFKWSDPISLGYISAGNHSLKFKVTTGGSYGTILDIFKIARQRIVHFDVPYSQKSQANYSGAACLKMALDREEPNSYTQQFLHSYAVAHNSSANLNGTYIDPQGMYLTLNNYELDPDYNYSYLSSSTLNEAYHNICYWLEYDIPNVAVNHMPAMIPLGGSYANWVIVNGYNASANPWQSANYTVYGFWITDPTANGIGQNIYKTAAELANDFIALATSDSWNGKYVTVSEPPAVQAQVTIAKPAKYKNRLESGNDIIAAAVKGLHDNLASDKEFQIAYADSRAGKPIEVNSDDGKYFIVPFIKADGCCIAVIIDAADGTFKQASYSKTPDANYLNRFDGKKGKVIRHKHNNAFLP